MRRCHDQHTHTRGERQKTHWRKRGLKLTTQQNASKRENTTPHNTACKAPRHLQDVVIRTVGDDVPLALGPALGQAPFVPRPAPGPKKQGAVLQLTHAEVTCRRSSQLGAVLAR